MKKSNLIAVGAMAIAGMATYLIRKAICARKEKKEEHLSTEHSRHLTNVFSKAKAAAN